VKADDCVRKVGVESHARSKRNREVGEQAHAEGTQCSNCGSRRDKIPLDELNALQILKRAVCDAVVLARSWAHTVAAAIGHNRCLNMSVMLLAQSHSNIYS
jgi:hypothetical protein